MSEALSFQKQIAELKQNLEELARENVEARLSLSELSLKTEELKICNAELAKVSDARKRCQKWADDLDTEKSDQAAELNEASAKLAEEQALVDQATRRAEETARRLELARSSLAHIEEQKNASVARLEEELQVRAWRRLRPPLPHPHPLHTHFPPFPHGVTKNRSPAALDNRKSLHLPPACALSPARRIRGRPPRRRGDGGRSPPKEAGRARRALQRGAGAFILPTETRESDVRHAATDPCRWPL